ncbi:MAG: hypothetical protein LBE13_10850 [Bacteroidales bacterium]|jgi:hypothetical protein|nr:hypothetical protein [Bacteroidales bacterium]
MAKNNRIFISFAIEDENLRNLLVGQARNDNTPFEFVDMSVKEPWDSEWKARCRTKIKSCDGMIVIVTQDSKKATGQLWEVKCTKEENIPRRGIWGHSDNKPIYLPEELNGIRIVEWTWANIKSFLDSL